MVQFFVGLHQPHNAGQFERSMISVNRLEGRVSGFPVNDWLLDSGAFTRISKGGAHLTIADYARQINRFTKCGNLLAAVAQDYMCEPFILDITGLSVRDHQEMTLERYATLKAMELDTPIMPVIQGYEPWEYAQHVDDYGALLQHGAWVGVGSVCKRNASPWSVVAVLEAITECRPDLRLHGFGIKTRALQHQRVVELLYSCDSMAWSFAARYAGKNANDPQEAARFVAKLKAQPIQAYMRL